MAIAVADKVSGYTGAAPLSLAWPLGAPAAGDVLLAVVIGNYGALPIAPTGWTLLYADNSGWGYGLFWRLAGASEPASVSWANGVTANIYVSMIRITGAASTTPQWSQTSGSNPLTTAAITPAAVGALVLALFCAAPAITAFSTASGCTAQTSTILNYGVFIETQNALTANTSTPIAITCTFTGTSQFDGFEVIVAAAGGGGSAIGNADFPPGHIGNGGVSNGTLGNGFPGAP